jgi:hypothetical protein
VVLLQTSLSSTVSGWLRLTVLAPSRSRPDAQNGSVFLRQTFVPHRPGCEGAMRKLLVLLHRHCAGEINQRQQHEYDGLHERDKQMQCKKNDWYSDRDD